MLDSSFDKPRQKKFLRMPLLSLEQRFSRFTLIRGVMRMRATRLVRVPLSFQADMRDIQLGEPRLTR